MNLKDKSVTELKQECKERGLKGYSKLRKDDLVALLEEKQDVSEPETAPPVKGRSPSVVPGSVPGESWEETRKRQERNRRKARRRNLRKQRKRAA